MKPEPESLSAREIEASGHLVKKVLERGTSPHLEEQARVLGKGVRRGKKNFSNELQELIARSVENLDTGKLSAPTVHEIKPMSSSKTSMKSAAKW